MDSDCVSIRTSATINERRLEFVGASHYQIEVGIIVDRGADGGVVVDELLLGYDAVWVGCTSFEVFQETSQDVSFGQFAAQILGMVLHRINVLQIVNGDLAIGIGVQLIEGLFDDIQAACAHWRLCVKRSVLVNTHFR